MVRFACSLAIVAWFALSAAADRLPPHQVQFKRVPYENVMKLAEEIPGYKFFAFWRLGLGGEELIGEELKLGTEKGIAVFSTSSPSQRTGVVAVPEKVLDEVKTKENLAKMLSRESADKLPAGVVIYETRGDIRDLPESDPRTKVENVITVALDDKAGVKFTAQETPAPAGDGAASEPGARSQLAMVIAGIAAALAIVTLGLWYFRR